MATSSNDSTSTLGGIVKIYDHIKRAFAEFLFLPTLIIIIFLLLFTGSYVLDHTQILSLNAFRHFMKIHFFPNISSTSELMSTIAGSVITMAALTVTLLLIVVQQTAATLTPQVFDQFLRRRQNQIYFGFFIGLALYTLILMTTVQTPVDPIFGTALGFLLTFIALYLLIVLVYTTINQIRPEVIIEAIHDHILAARKHQLVFINQMRSRSYSQNTISEPVITSVDGFVTHINLNIIKTALEKIEGEIEIVLAVSIGTYVGFGDVIAHVNAQTSTIAVAMSAHVTKAIHIEQQRDVMSDPAYGIEQLQMIGWTSISTAKANPMPGLQTIRNLRDVLARWENQEEEVTESNKLLLPVVYTDNVITQLMDTFENLAIISSESMQHQNMIEILNTFLILFEQLHLRQQQRIVDIVSRLLSAMADFVLTAKLSQTLNDLANMFQIYGYEEKASAVRTALAQFQRSIGKLCSRSTRSKH